MSHGFRALPVLLLGAVLAVSGCTIPGLGGGQTAGGTGPGVVILDFIPDLNEVFSGENVRMQLRIQNQGEARARNVVAELTGIDPSEWGGLGGFSTAKQWGDLVAFDPATGIPGEVQIVTFTGLKAPFLSEGLQFTHTPIARVSYDYSTVAIKPITLVDEVELTNIKQQGGTLASKPTTHTKGPLQVEITMQNFKKTSGFGGGFGQTFDIFPVQIKVTNLLHGQGGTVVPQTFFGGPLAGFGNELAHPIRIKITPPSGTNFVFGGFGDDCSGFLVDVEMFQGKDATITCELQVINAPTIKQEGLFQVEATYRYFVEKQTQIKVTGTGTPGSFFPF